jgi:hypothetical protein
LKEYDGLKEPEWNFLELSLIVFSFQNFFANRHPDFPRMVWPEAVFLVALDPSMKEL